jgi:uroporphyrinogen decarboxylase
LQPWRSFKPDGVILFSDILTPLPGIGVSFEIDDNKGPLLDDPIRSADQVRTLCAYDSNSGSKQQYTVALRCASEFQ